MAERNGIHQGNWMCEKCGLPKSSYKIHNDVNKCRCEMEADGESKSATNAGYKIFEGMTQDDKNSVIEILADKVNFYVDKHFDLLAEWEDAGEQLRVQCKKQIEECIKRELNMILP